MNFFQSLTMTHQKDTRVVFLDIPKAFDEIWIPGLTFKFKSFVISGDFLKLIKNFLINRFRKFSLNGLTSKMRKN